MLRGGSARFDKAVQTKAYDHMRKRFPLVGFPCPKLFHPLQEERLCRTCSELTDRDDAIVSEQLTRMLQKARPAPHMLPAIPINAPGHIPKVKPMRVRDDAKPKRGGCEDKTDDRI
jgi:hypothetical protein